MKNNYLVVITVLSIFISATAANAQLGQLWGVTSAGGANNGGVLYFFDPGSGKDSIVYNFPSNSDPEGTPMQAKDGNIYGTSRVGGSGGYGYIYQYNPVTATFTIKASFAGGASGSNPYCTLIQSAFDGNLYGTTESGGAGNYGTIFQYNISTNTLAIIYAFNGGTLGNTPYSGVVEGTSGTLYGTTYGGGANSKGTLYKYALSPGTYTNLYSFAAASGSLPYGTPYFASDGNLYGMTSSGGAPNAGVMYKYTIAGSTYADLASFPTSSDPEGCFIGAGSTLYGLVGGGGSTGNGTIISCTFGGTVTTLYNFGAPPDGGIPRGNPCLASDGNLYGVTSLGGSSNVGIMFKIPASGGTYTDLFSFTGPNGKQPNYNSSVMELMSVGIKESEPGCSTQVLTAMPRGYAGTLTYSWSTGATTSSITATSSGTYTVTATDGRGITVSNTFTLGVNYSALSATISYGNVSCNGGNNGFANAYVSGGFPPFSYAWTNGATTTSISALTANNYTCTVTDVNGCISSPTVTIDQPSALSLSTSGNTAICNGGSTSLSVTPSGGTASYTYNWEPSTGLSATTGSTVTAFPTTSGFYTIQVIDANNCVASNSIDVTVNPTPTVNASASPTSICAGNSTPITSTVTGGTAPFTYNWGPSSSLSSSSTQNVTATPGSSTTYTLYATDANNCTSIVDVPVTVNSLPTVTANASPSTMCQGSSSVLTASGATSYTWAPGATLNVTTGTNVNATPTISTTYTVTGTNGNGCVNTTTVAVTVNAIPASPTAGSNSPICAGSTLNLTATTVAGATYAWTGPNTYSATTQNPSLANATIAAAGTYSVTATKSGCTSAAGTVAVTVNAIPSTPTAGSNTPICSGTALNLTASTVAGATYAWTGPNAFTSTSQNPSVTNATTAATGTYSVTAKKSGCTSPAGTTVVVVNPQPTVTVNESPTAICLGNSSTLTATGSGGATPYTYSWAPATDLSVTTGNIVSASPGTTYTYTVTIMDANGCSNTGGAPITVNYAPGLSFTPTSATICSGGNTGITVSGASTYVWSPGSSLNCSNCATVTASPTVNTVYTVTGISAAGCTNTDTVSVFINSLPTITASASSPTICIGSNSTLTASGGSSYTWSPSTGLTITTGANVTASPTISVTYTVTGTNSAGCQNTQTVSVTVNALPTVGANPVSNPICKGSPTTITASGASTYTWAPSTGLSVTTGTNVSANPSSAITYTVTGTDVNGCISTVTVAMGVNSLPVVTANASPTSICAGNSSSISGGGAINYVWSPAATLTSSTGTVVGASPTTTTAYTVTGTDGNGCSNIANVVVNVDNPNINFTQANVSCNGACNGTLLANVSGGTPPYNYSWSNSQTSALASNLCPATYKLTLTDNFGCSSSKTATITQPSAITLNVSSAATTCGLANGSATATPSGGSAPYNYSWNTKPAQTTSVANGLAAGTYSITVTDGNGCTAIKSVTVNGSSGPSISSTQITQSSCGVNDGKATITVTGGVLPYTYSWNNGDTIATDSNLAAGTYIATVTDKNGCSTFGAVIINDASGPVISVNSVTNINCYGASSGAISTSVTGGQSPYFYSWSNSATTQNINGLTAGPYQFTVSDANGCTAVQNINITQPSELITSTNTSAASCGSSDGSVSVTVSGGTTPYSYLWNNSTTNSSISNVGAGTYSVTVTDNNGCTSVADASISNASGPLVTIDSVVDINCSSGATGEITIAANGGTPPYTYLWSNGDTTANLYNVAAGEYALTVTDASGCAGTANATITQSQISPIAICMATVDPATNYNNLSWDASNFTGGIVACNIYKETTTPGVFNKIGSVSAAKGLYVDTLSDARKRSWRYEISEVDSCGVESPLSAPFKTMHLTINLGASNAINLIWDNFQGINFNYYIVYRDSVAGIASDSIDYVTNNGIYTYTDYPPLTGSWYYHMGISSSGACASVIHPHSIEAINYNASKSNTGTVTFGPTGIPNVSSPGSLDIYPNPTRGVFNMSLVLNSQQNVDIKIYNTLGQVIKEETYGQSYGKAIKQFDMSAYGKGVYFVKVTTNNDVQYRKVVIQ